MALRTTLSVAVCCWLCWASVAQAHITLISPPPRTEDQKEGPCGLTGLARGDTVAVFRPGETITVMWEETINHTAHYRIAFDADGDDDFVPPAGRADLYNSPAVLVDGIADSAGGRYTQDITFPDIECERCTLQLIQVMYGSGNYFQCTDIALRPEGTVPPDAGAPPVRSDAGAPPGGTDGGPVGTDSGGCSVSGSRPASPAAMMVIALVLLRRLRGRARSDYSRQ